MKLTLLMVFLTVCTAVYGQRTVEERKKELLKIAESIKIKDAERKERVRQYLNNGTAPQFENVQQDDGTIITRLLYDIDASGQPVYVATDNADAAVTTGADFLADENGLGFGLTGEGVKVAVWDGGLIRTSHVEFASGDVSLGDQASTLNFHANHVMGTIMASGVNETAKGMAPKVQLTAFDFGTWEGEVSEMASPDDTGLLLSNHSYGDLMGWAAGTWRGDPEISNQEDWKFGFYNNTAQFLDNIAYNSPYYLMCWSAGNQRGDQPGEIYPADGPFDCIGSEKTAKNILAVGAVRKLSSGYEGPSDVVMSSFSSWGPVDDGRIKPDLVGAGVNLFSTLEDSDDHYGSLSGTSMSTPNVAGTLALLQELNRKVRGSYLKSATLKGLAIHTAEEAGPAVGPDYQFGWGLMNGKGAANLILQENGVNKVIRNVTLKNNGTYSLEIEPNMGEDVKVTICWTDLPGTPVDRQLDPMDLMLVNDLDLRVSNRIETYMPYILDPIRPTLPATTGDNFRDNIEKVEFTATDEGPYTITVSHKDELEGGEQEFALIVAFEANNYQTFYRVGAGSDWNNPENWSMSSGGDPAMQVPGAKDKVIIDNNSFEQMSSETSESQREYTISDDIEIKSLVVTSSKPAIINLNENDIILTGSISSAVGEVSFAGGGKVILKDDTAETNYISGGKDSFAEVDLVIDYRNGSTAIVNSDFRSRKITVENGMIEFDNAEPTIQELELKNESLLKSRNSQITVSSLLDLSETASVQFQNTRLNIKEQAILKGITDLGDLSIAVSSGSTLTIENSTIINSLNLDLASNLILANGSTITVLNDMSAVGKASGESISINSIGNKAFIALPARKLYCFDFLDVDGVDISGSGAFNVGLNGSVQNAEGWQQKACADVLFADFTIDRICAGAVQSASDVSKGNVTAWRWFVNDVLVSETAIPTFDFPESGSYQIRLEVTDDVGDTDDFVQDLVAGSNTLEENEVLISNGQLVSVKPADTYQWYFNGAALDGATARTYALTDEAGTYFVVTGDGECFRKSEEVEFIVTSTDDDPQLSASYNVYPNPARDLLTIAVESLHRGEVIIELTDMSGRVLVSDNFTKNQFAFEQAIDTSELPNGLYVINVVQGSEKETRLIAVDK